MVRFSEAFVGAAILLVMLVSVGCDQLQSDTNNSNTKQQQQQQQQPQPPPPRREHHFDPIARSEGNLAVDTTTGQMCKTWAWVCSGGNSSSSYGISCSAIEEMPTCESISRE